LVLKSLVVKDLSPACFVENRRLKIILGKQAGFEVNRESWRREWDAYRTFWLSNPGITVLDAATV
jgi:hypothetical protein